MLEPSPAATPTETSRMAKASVRRHIITCEFPPQTGGVGDYSYYVAKGLAANGNDVHVWCPVAEGSYSELAGVTVHGDLGAISPFDIFRLDRNLNRFEAPRRILLQWVPHGYKYRSLNVPFCFWILKRAVANADSIDVMIHEPFLTFRGGSWKQIAAALCHRIMIVSVLAAASNVWLATLAWAAKVKPYCFGREVPLRLLPVPSNIPVFQSDSRVALIRQQYAGNGELLLGHFGTYGSTIANILSTVISPVLESSGAYLILMGKGSQEFRDSFVQSNPKCAGRLNATGALDSREISCHIQSCDLMIQPYSDGITTRRGSAMVCLAHGRPIVTTSGPLTEAIWSQSGAVALVEIGNTAMFVDEILQMIKEDGRRLHVGRAGAILYRTQFDLRHTLAALGSE